jgi:hypothetical protein
MKRSKLLLLTLAVPALVSLAVPGDRLHFAPEAGTELTKSFNTTVELSLDEMRMVMNGEEQDPSMFEMEMTMTNSSEYSWTDTYMSLGEGRPTQLVRSFDTLSNMTTTSQSNQFTGSVDFDVSSTSELDGVSIVFTWNEEDGEFVASFPEDEEGDADLLEDLTEDTDLRGFLPEGAVAEGDTWSADPGYLINLLGPGGNLKLVPNEEDLPDGAGPQPGSDLSFNEMLGEIEGEVTCEYKGLRDVDGHKLASIAIEIDVSSANDLTELIKKKMEEIDLSAQGVEMDFQSADVELAVEGEGTLLWDVEGGFFSSFEFSGDMSQTMDMAMSMNTPGGDMDIEQTMEMSGTIEFDFGATKE